MHRTHIKPNRSWLSINWKEIVEYRDLLWFLVLRDLTAIYKQSILGPLWFVIQPLASTLVFTVVFGHIAKIGTDNMPPFLFYISGMVLWNYFQGVMNGVSGSLITNANLMGKVYFPRLIMPLSLMLSNLGQFALNFMIFVGFYVYYLFFTSANIRPTPALAMFPLLVIQTGIVGLGVGLWLSALTVKYRDLRFALPFLAQLWMFATPIVYPASNIVVRKWCILMAINPMASLVELTRFMFLGVGKVDAEFITIGAVSGIFMLVTGLVIFNRVQRTFVDTI